MQKCSDIQTPKRGERKDMAWITMQFSSHMNSLKAASMHEEGGGGTVLKKNTYRDWTVRDTDHSCRKPVNYTLKRGDDPCCKCSWWDETWYGQVRDWSQLEVRLEVFSM